MISQARFDELDGALSTDFETDADRKINELIGIRIELQDANQSLATIQALLFANGVLIGLAVARLFGWL